MAILKCQYMYIFTYIVKYQSFSPLTLSRLGNFSCFFCRLLIFFKSTFFKKLFQEYHLSVKQLGSRSGLTCCWAWSGSKLFAKVISRRYSVGNELTLYPLVLTYHLLINICKQFGSDQDLMIHLTLFLKDISCHSWQLFSSLTSTYVHE